MASPRGALLASCAAADLIYVCPHSSQDYSQSLRDATVAVVLLLRRCTMSLSACDEGLRIHQVVRAMPTFALDTVSLPDCALSACARQGMLRRLDYEKVVARFALTKNAHGA